jgi:hypothetical protein
MGRQLLGAVINYYYNMPDLLFLHHEAHRKSLENLVTIKELKGQWQGEQGSGRQGFKV